MADQWKELSGERNWEGLLKPLNGDLQKRIELYGERIQAICDSMTDDKRHPTHEKEDLFSKVIMKTDKFGKLYTVTDYIYAMSDVPSWIDWIVKDQSAWIGYVAVATDKGKEVLGRRDILICWRGTYSKAEWIKDFEFFRTQASNILGETHNPLVHGGFLSLYTSKTNEPEYNNLSARDQVLNAVNRLLNMPDYRDEEISITVTGHSLGAALATLNATDMVFNKHNECTGSDKICMVTAFVLASPKVGDKGFKNVFNGLNNLHLLNIRHKSDIVTRVPPYPYRKVGTKLRIGSYKAGLRKLIKDGIPKLKNRHQFQSLPQHLFDKWFQFHSLQEYLDEVAGRRKKYLAGNIS
ncbi:phospholipase A1-II 1-like [Pistacia vera]|uniref:phospholipase A1-II 1-like n=1 Tax=Pistacia vera TaxID=55513 RepID=UPI001263BAA5|nr:phospholipase A1-II 1-like [Pistacia vera]XP_031257066.1 phospholipase A1-II 1-like [Pistacia vera]